MHRDAHMAVVAYGDGHDDDLPRQRVQGAAFETGAHGEETVEQLGGSGQAANRVGKCACAALDSLHRRPGGVRSGLQGVGREHLSPNIDNMVDDTGEMVNQVDDLAKWSEDDSGADGPPRAGYELALLLFAGFRTLIDELHAELARQGHPDMRPAHGFAMQAIGVDGASASDIGRRLGISKQAAGKTVDRLVVLGYAERADDPTDTRRRIVRLTARGFDGLARSAEIFQRLRGNWALERGEDRIRAMEDDLRAVTTPVAFRLDAAGWLGRLT